VPITVRHLVTHTSSILDKQNYVFRAWILRDTTDLQEPGPRYRRMPLQCAEHGRIHGGIPARYLAKDGAWYSDSAFADLEPGERFGYSNIGATLAALVVEKATGYAVRCVHPAAHPRSVGHALTSTWHGEDLPDTAISCLYRDTHRTLSRATYCTTYPDGGMVTSSSDFAKYMAELVRGFRGEGTILSKASYAEYFREQLVDYQLRGPRNRNVHR
jgi:hypothetical protein